jgi:hypothetical protein
MKVLKEILNWLVFIVFIDFFVVIMLIAGVAAGDVQLEGWHPFWWIQAHYIVVSFEFIKKWILNLLLLF